MKTVTGRVISSEPISLSKATKILSGFASSNNGASQDVSAYLRRASAAFTELKSIHRDIKSSSGKKKNTGSNARRERSPNGEFEQLGRAKGIDNLVEIREKSGFRNSETVSEEKSNYVREQNEKKSKKKKEEDDFEEKVKEKLEEKSRDEERKEKKRKKKKTKEEDVFEKEKLEEETRDEERKEKKKKKKRKSDGEIGSEERERKSKKKRKSKENDS